MLIKQTRINGFRITLMEAIKNGAKSYSVTKYTPQGTIAERLESRWREMADGAFERMADSERGWYVRDAMKEFK